MLHSPPTQLTTPCNGIHKKSTAIVGPHFLGSIVIALAGNVPATMGLMEKPKISQSEL